MSGDDGLRDVAKRIIAEPMNVVTHHHHQKCPALAKTGLERGTPCLSGGQ